MHLSTLFLPVRFDADLERLESALKYHFPAVVGQFGSDMDGCYFSLVT
jgi:hypothetical protein